MIYRIAIIGGGVAAVAQVAHLLKELDVFVPSCEIKITIFEKNGSVGAGLPYSNKEDCYILNLPPTSMDILPGRTGDFANWLAGNYPNYPLFPPRHYFGTYVKEVIQQLQEEAKNKNVTLELLTKQTISHISPIMTGSYAVHTDDNASSNFNAVILCTGHLPSNCYSELQKTENYCHNPLDSQFYEKINSNNTLLIVGTRLSGIDSALKARSIGHKGKIIMASRSGLLPTVLSEKINPHTLKYITIHSLMKLTHNNIKPLKLRDLYQLMQNEFSEVMDKEFNLNSIKRSDKDISASEWLKIEIDTAKQEKPWQNILFSLYPIIPSIWPLLDIESQKEFMLKYYSTFMTYMAAFPLVNAKKIKSMMDSGQLIVTGGISSINSNNEGYTFDIHGKEMFASYIINATGPGSDIRQVATYDHMLKNGTITQNALGGLNVHPYTLQVMQDEEKSYENWYCIGNPTTGNSLAMLDVNQVTAQAETVAAGLVPKIKELSLRKPHSKFPSGPHPGHPLSSPASLFYRTKNIKNSSYLSNIVHYTTAILRKLK